MPKEIGPREKALREQREAAFEENRRQQKTWSDERDSKPISLKKALQRRIAVASTKRGKPRKAKK